MFDLKPSQDVRPLSELKSHLSEVVRQIENSGRPVVLTRHGRGVVVMLSVEAYEELDAMADQRRLQRAVEEGERDMQAGRIVEFDEMDAHLERLSEA